MDLLLKSQTDTEPMQDDDPQVSDLKFLFNYHTVCIEYANYRIVLISGWEEINVV